MLEKEERVTQGVPLKTASRTVQEKKTVKKITIWVMEEEVDLSDVPQPPTQSVAKEVQRPLRKESPNEILKTPPVEMVERTKLPFVQALVVIVMMALLVCLGLCLMSVILFCVNAGLSFLGVMPFPESKLIEMFQQISDGWLAVGVLIFFGGALATVGILLDDTIE